jgi:inorganic pyrophosphatase
MENETKQTTISTDFLGKTVTVKIDRPLNSKHPKFDWPYELNYGFVPDTLSPDGEELDAYVIGVNGPVENFTGTCVAVIHRTNDNDDKLIVVSDDQKEIADEEIRKATHFQEQYFTSEILRSA